MSSLSGGEVIEIGRRGMEMVGKDEMIDARMGGGSLIEIDQTGRGLARTITATATGAGLGLHDHVENSSHWTCILVRTSHEDSTSWPTSTMSRSRPHTAPPSLPRNHRQTCSHCP